MKDQLTSVVYDLTRLIDKILHQLKISEDDFDAESKEVLDVAIMMIQSTGVSCHSILKLTAEIDMSIKDCFGISRSICETATNVAYIIINGKSAAARAEMHAAQRVYRDTQRVINIGDVILRSDIGLGEREIPEHLKESLDLFTTKKGKEIKSWIDVSVEKRIDVIRQKYPSQAISFHAANASIYDISSQMLHGSLYSHIYFWTENGEKIKSKKQFIEFATNNHFVSIFSGLFFSVSAMLIIVTNEYYLPSVQEEISKLRERTLKAFELTDEY